MVSYLRPDDSQLLQRELEPAILWVLDLENDRAVGATDPLMDGVRAEVSEETEETVEAAVVEEAEEAVEAAVAEAVEEAGRRPRPWRSIVAQESVAQPIRPPKQSR